MVSFISYYKKIIIFRTKRFLGLIQFFYEHNKKILHGDQERYHHNGNLNKKEIYDNGIIQNLIRFTKKNKTLEQCYYKDGKLHGRQYFPSEKPHNNQRHKKSHTFHRKYNEESYYNNSVLDGMIKKIEYYQNAELINEINYYKTQYKNNILVESKKYNRSDNIQLV